MRALVAALLQLVGLAAVVTAGFLVATALGVVAAGLAVLVVGLSLEGD